MIPLHTHLHPYVHKVNSDEYAFFLHPHLTIVKDRHKKNMSDL